MDINKISKLQTELIQNIDYDELDNGQLVKFTTSLLNQYKAAKKVIRSLEATDSVTEVTHWSFIKDYCEGEIQNLLEVINQRLTVDLEEFGIGTTIKFIDLVASIRLALFVEAKADIKATTTSEPEQFELIFE